TSIPEEIGQLTNLQKLNLGMNELTSIPAALLLKGIDLFLEDNPLSFKINASIFLKDNIKQISIIASAAALTVFGLYYYPSSVPNAISSLRGLCWRLRVMTTAMPLDMWPEFILREIFGPRH
ncbi:MAG: hypothetical protein JSS30_02175, partial [Verrucomicrobia bacterium]|nr:hypothetical protein [Verrucomicrobiota bacterium]